MRSARPVPEPRDNQERLLGKAAGRGEVHKTGDEPTGRNPEAREADWYNALKSAIF
jgi:hypothetical protein